MEYQFPKESVDYLKRVLWNTRKEEQTMEVKLTDAMPDIGKVICAWGQPLIRGKEWRGSTMGISGGVMAWVLYLPEGGGAPAAVECWIPFQMRWDIPQSKRDGSIRGVMQVCDMDARSISARKLMVRSVVSAAVEAMETVQTELFMAQQVPEDIQLLRKSYPATLPKEAGERVIELEEELSVPASVGSAAKLAGCTLQPVITEKKVMGDKLVFRGTAQLCCIWLCDDGAIKSNEYEFPFSQYAELTANYESQGMADVIPAVTNLELELQENGEMRLKAGLVGQYVIWDTPVLTVIEDAYSTERQVMLRQQPLELPVLLDASQQTLRAEYTMEPEAGELAAGELMLAQPEVRMEENGVRLEMEGLFQLLTYPEGENPQCIQPRWEGNVTLPGNPDHDTFSRLSHVRCGRMNHGGGDMAVYDVTLDTVSVGNLAVNMVTALELGEPAEPDPGRPSLILMRADDQGLWELAKSCGSTIQAIEEANALTEEPLPGQMLLIPVR